MKYRAIFLSIFICVIFGRRLITIDYLEGELYLLFDASLFSICLTFVIYWIKYDSK